MTAEYYRIIDACRRGLLTYLERVITQIPLKENISVLDAGCGTGVPTLFLAGQLNCKITALDTDKKALDFLKEKAEHAGMGYRVKIINNSATDHHFEESSFDIILAEGLLNIIGFVMVLVTFQGVNLLDEVFKLNSIHAYAEGGGVFFLVVLGLAIFVPTMMYFLPMPKEDVSRDEESLVEAKLNDGNTTGVSANEDGN